LNYWTSLKYIRVFDIRDVKQDGRIEIIYTALVYGAKALALSRQHIKQITEIYLQRSSRNTLLIHGCHICRLSLIHLLRFNYYINWFDIMYAFTLHCIWTFHVFIWKQLITVVINTCLNMPIICLWAWLWKWYDKHGCRSRL